MNVLLIHGVNTNEDQIPNPYQAWEQAIQTGLTNSGYAGDINFNRVNYNDIFDTHPVNIAICGLAAAELVASVIATAPAPAPAAAPPQPGTDISSELRWTAGMVAQWVVEDSLRADCCTRLFDQITAAKPDLIFAHSLGTLLTYDFFLHDPRSQGLFNGTLVTFGTQIGNVFVRDHMWGGNVGMLNNVGTWYNLYNPNDPVFVAPVNVAANNFHQFTTVFGNSLLDLSGHDVTSDANHPGYLDNPTTIANLWPALAGGTLARIFARNIQILKSTPPAPSPVTSAKLSAALALRPGRRHHFSAPKLHPIVLRSEEHKQLAAAKFLAIAAERAKRQSELRALSQPAAAADKAAPAPAPAPASLSINLSTISMLGNFDAYITIQFQGNSTPEDAMVVDSGNSVLVVPNWDHIQNNPAYTVLGTATEPWGCPANVVKGPILIPAADGSVYTITDCIFYACTGPVPGGTDRTANFGTGCIKPWSTVQLDNSPSSVVMQAPLSYNPAYPFADFAYDAQILSASSEPNVSDTSLLVLYQSLPPDYTMLNIRPAVEWMSVTPLQLNVGTVTTPWPGPLVSPIAMVDTGGGSMFLSDPNGAVFDKSWAAAVACPVWPHPSQDCVCVQDSLGIKLGDGTSSYSYTIDTSKMPASVQGLTAMMCRSHYYMMCEQGMNIGGISALFNHIMIDYAGTRVGFKPR